MQLAGTHLGVILAHTALALPVAFLVICATLKGFDRNLERAAMISGAGPLRTFFLRDTAGAAAGHAGRRAVRLPASFNEAVVAIFIAGRDAVDACRRRCSRASGSNPIPIIAVISTLLAAAVLAGVLCVLRLPPQAAHVELDALLRPRSVAILGASERPSIGRSVMASLDKLGLPGRVYPGQPEIPRAPRPALLSARSRPAQAPDVVAFCVSNERVARAMCGSPPSAAARGAVIYDGGFAERGEEGARAAGRRSPGCAARPGIALCGPNCMGVLNPHDAEHHLHAGASRTRAALPAMSGSSRRAARSASACSRTAPLRLQPRHLLRQRGGGPAPSTISSAWSTTRRPG